MRALPKRSRLDRVFRTLVAIETSHTLVRCVAAVTIDRYRRRTRLRPDICRLGLLMWLNARRSSLPRIGGVALAQVAFAVDVLAGARVKHEPRDGLVVHAHRLGEA